MTERDVQNAPIKWKVQGAGFVMKGEFVVAGGHGTPTRSPCVELQRPRG